ncbi:MAG TPA: single-stranded DNA-binding protein [bacterium]
MLNLKMPDINSVMIAGNLTNNPSYRKTTNGTPVANFYVASNRKFKDSSGQWRENVCFVGVVAWHKLAESCVEFLTKGSSVLVEGELQSRTWKNDDGTNNNVVEIKARRIQFLDRHSKKEGSMIFEESGEVGLADAEGHHHDSVHFEQPSATVSETPRRQESTNSSDTNSEFNFGYDNLKF